MGKHALVVGCGIGGPAVALFLQRAGVDVTIFEAASEASEEGAFLNLASNGLRVLEALGLGEQIAAIGFRCPQMEMWSGNGKRLGRVRNGAKLTEGQPSQIVKRGDLHRVLRDEAMRRSIPIEFGRALADLRQDATGVQVTFEDGSTSMGDLVIGCDGIHSRTRRAILPDAPTPRYTGLVSCGGYSVTDQPPTPDTQHFVFGKHAFFGYLVKPSGEAYWFNNHAVGGQPRRSDFADIDAASWKRKLMAQHADDQPFIAQMIAATTSPITAYPLYDMPPVARWHQGRVTIMGDAAHATSPSAGQGASMALEDALVLARCVRDVPHIEEAFAAFERLRKERAERVVKFGRTSGSNKVSSNAVARGIRDLVMPFVLRRFADARSLDWLYSYDVRWDAPVAV